MLLKFFGFALLYLFYIAVVLAGMAWTITKAYKLNLENFASPTITMIALLIVLMLLIGLPLVLIGWFSKMKP